MQQKFLQSKEKIHILNTFFDCFEKNYHKLRQYNKNGLNSGENNLAPDFYVIFYLKYDISRVIFRTYIVINNENGLSFKEK